MSLVQFQADLKFFGDDAVRIATLILQDAAEVAAEAVVVGNEFGLGTPLETGILRGSFRVSLNTPELEDGEGGGVFDTSAIARATLSDTIYVTSGNPYGGFLEDNNYTRRHGEHIGSPTPFIHPVEEQFTRIVNRSAVRVLRRADA